MARFGDDGIKQPEEFFSTFEQFLSKIDESRTENDQMARKEEEERKKKEAAAAAQAKKAICLNLSTDCGLIAV